MIHCNVVKFPAERDAVLQGAARKRRRGDKNSIRALADPLLDRVDAAPPGFQKLFLLRLEIMVNELEMDVEEYSARD